MHALSEKLTAFDGEDKANGILLGDSTARAVETRVRSALNTPIAGGMFSGLAEIGVSLQRDGTMEIDDEALDDALANNLGGIGALLAGEGEAGGLSKVVVDAVEIVAGEKGLLAAASDGMQARIDSLSDQMERQQESIDATIARYKKQFIELDSIMATLNSTSNYLTQQFEALSKQTD